MARQFVQDIQIVQGVLQENSLDPSLAPQLVMNIQSSQHLVDTQRELHYQSAMFHLHQRQLDRQLSQHQHHESIQAMKYDPNWKIKLIEMKNSCWNVSSNLTRLWWEVLFIRQVVLGIIPVATQYYYQADSTDGNPDLLFRLRWGRILSTQQQQSQTILIKDLVVSILSEVCACHQLNQNSVETTTSTITTSSEFSTTTGFLLLKTLLRQSAILEYYTCYVYCLLSVSFLLCTTMVLHHCLRTFSVPSLIHHIINLVALVILYGHERIITFCWDTMMTVTFISEHYYQRDDEGLATAMMIEILLLISLLIILPLVTWMHTQQLFHQIHHKITNANASNFEISFQHGQDRLERWYWKQLSIRYALLSIYSSIIVLSFWERKKKGNH